MASSSQRAYAGDEEFAANKERIAHLYRTLGLPLKDVMSIMERDHGFHATRRMYKTRIKNWGLEKNIKAAELAEMVRLQRERDAVNKPTVFYVKGKKLDRDEVEKYLKRNPALMIKLNNGDIEVGDASGLICKTPPPSLAQGISVCPEIEPTEDLSIPKDISRLARKYCLDAVEFKIWENGDGTIESRQAAEKHRRLKQWGESLLFARHLIAESQFECGFKLLSYCLDQLSQLLNDEDPALLFHLIQVQVAFCQQGVVDNLEKVKKLVCEHVRSMTKKTWRPDHRAHALTLLLDRIEVVIQSNLTSTVGIIPTDWLSARLEVGRNHHDSSLLLFYEKYVTTLWMEYGSDSKENIELFTRIVRSFEASELDRSRQVFYLVFLTHLTGVLIQIGQPEYAAKILIEERNRFSPSIPNDSPWRLEARWWWLFNMTKVSSSMGIHKEAIEFALWLQTHSHDVYGAEHKYTVDSLEVLWKTRNAAGELKVAAELKNEWERAVKDLVDREISPRKANVEDDDDVEEPFEDPCITGATLAYSWQNTTLFTDQKWQALRRKDFDGLMNLKLE